MIFFGKNASWKLKNLSPNTTTRYQNVNMMRFKFKKIYRLPAVQGL